MIALLLAVMLPIAPDAGVKWIAHRGGVVDAQHRENSLGSLQEAIERGYWMIELDIRRSKDGELVVQHDKDLRRLYDVKENVADLTWDELRKLRSRIDGQPPCTFAEFAACCRGKARLMVDTEETGAQGGFFEKIEQVLSENELLDSAFFIGSAQQKAYFKGKARIAADRDSVKKATAAGEPVSSLYFLFEHGTALDEETVNYGRSVNVPVVASVNNLHYIVRRDKATAECDIHKLLGWGVEYYQIDSDFEPFFTKK